MKNRPTRRLAAALLFSSSLLFAGDLRAAEVVVFAASSLTNVLQELAPAFEKASGQHLVFNFGASSLLERQIEEGAPADVFFSADEGKMDRLEQRGALLAGSRHSLLSNTLVAVVAKDGSIALTRPENLAAPQVRALALAEPQSVPAGIYARQYLEGLGLWQRVSARVVPTENVRAALAAVESGSADAAIVFRSDAAISQKVRVAFEVPAGEGPTISYPVAILAESRAVQASRQFVDFLQAPEAKAAFRRALFVVPE